MTTNADFSVASRDNYIRDPHQIEQESFQRIRALSDLSRFTPDQAQLAMRLIHTCGEPSISDRIHMSDSAITAGLGAIQANAPLLCDVEMVKHGITKRLIQQDAYCFLNDPRVPGIAQEEEETRTMAALRFWEPLLSGAIVLIGNAPTALFRLMEMIDNGSPKPALIIGIPVGFVGAAESKDALIAYGQQQDIPYITVTGYAGGSAMTAAALNALLRINQGIQF